MGLSCAEALARDGLRTCVVERLGLAAGASSAGQGGIGFGLFAGDYDLNMSLAAMAEYERFASEGGRIDFLKPGSLLLYDQQEEDVIKSRVAFLRTSGIACEWLDPSAVRAAEPRISSEVSGAVLLEDVASVNPMRVVGELARRATMLDTQILTYTELTGIEMRGGRVVAANTTRGSVATERIIISAGVWSPSVGQFVGLRVPVWPLKGHVLVTEPMEKTLRHLISETGFEAIAKREVEVAVGKEGPVAGPPQYAAVLQCQSDGKMLIGSSREFVGYDREVDRSRLAGIANRAVRIVPAMAKARVIRTYAGLRPWTSDGRPMVGATRQAEGIFFATGHAGEGIVLALLTGRLIADLISGRPTIIDMEPLMPDRFTMC